MLSGGHIRKNASEHIRIHPHSCECGYGGITCLGVSCPDRFSRSPITIAAGRTAQPGCAFVIGSKSSVSSACANIPIATAAFTAEHLDGFLFMEKTEIQDLTARLALIAVQGPQAPAVICALLGSESAELPRWGVGLVRWHETDLIIARTPRCGVITTSVQPSPG